MARVIGVEIPDNKRLEISLTYIFGIGRTTAAKIIKELSLDGGMKTRDLSEEQLTALAGHIQKTLSVEGQLRREIAGNISRLRDIACYRGLRHRRGLRRTRYQRRRAPRAGRAAAPRPGGLRAGRHEQRRPPVI